MTAEDGTWFCYEVTGQIRNADEIDVNTRLRLNVHYIPVPPSSKVQLALKSCSVQENQHLPRSLSRLGASAVWVTSMAI